MSQNSLLDLYAHPTVVARFSEMAALHPHREAIRDRFEVSTIGNSCIAPNNFPTIFSSIIRSREFVLECTANILGKALSACSPYYYPAITTYI